MSGGVASDFQGVVFKWSPLSLSLPCQTDRSGRLKLETVDDLFNILQLRKRRRNRKTPVHKKPVPEPETVVRLQSYSLSFSQRHCSTLRIQQTRGTLHAHLAYWYNLLYYLQFKYNLLLPPRSQSTWMSSCSWQRPWTTSCPWWTSTWATEEARTRPIMWVSHSGDVSSHNVEGMSASSIEKCIVQELITIWNGARIRLMNLF